MSHYLVEKAVTHRRRSTDLQSAIGGEWRYDRNVGAWVSRADASCLLAESHAAERPRPQTKKDDMETGEDQKGR